MNGTRVSRRWVLGAGAGMLAVLGAGCAAPPPTATTAPPTAAPTAPTAAPKPAGTGSTPAAPPAPTTVPAATNPAATTGPAPAAKRGGGGTLKLLYWQAPVGLNPHLTSGLKDQNAARIVLEPLITFDPQGAIVPVLAAEVPTAANGGLDPKGTSVTYKLRPGLKWADGKPCTAEDAVFTWKFCVDKTTGSVNAGRFAAVDRVEAVDATTVKVVFANPTAAWYVPFSAANGVLLPKHAFEGFEGAKAKDAPFNAKAFGTGPYTTESFASGDLAVFVPNPNYRDPAKPFFDRVQLKGGGDAPSAARAVLQTGEFDYAWNLQVEWAVLEDILKGGKGVLTPAPGSGPEVLFFNFSDPTTEVEGERSSPASKHPFLSDGRVRKALALAVDRQTIAKQLYGQTGEVTANWLTLPELASPNTKPEFDLAKANQLLDEAGYKKGGDGIRTTPDGKRMKLVFVTATNSLRQKEQAIIKDGWNKIGVDVELKAFDAGQYLADIPGNPDTFGHFYYDVQMFAGSYSSPDATSWMRTFASVDPAKDIAQKANDWKGSNFLRWRNDEYNALFKSLPTELDPAKRTAAFVRLNDMLFTENVIVPLVDRRRVAARATNLVGPQPPVFDTDTWNIADWRRS